MATDDRDLLFRAQRLVDGGSPMADTLLENASLRTRIAALESQLADRDAEIERLRARLDEAEIERVRSGLAWSEENAELRADLLWAVRNDVEAFGVVQVDLFVYGEHVSRCDDTPDAICRAVREARDGEADS